MKRNSVNLKSNKVKENKLKQYDKNYDFSNIYKNN